jgi:hypothetical protein
VMGTCGELIATPGGPRFGANKSVEGNVRKLETIAPSLVETCRPRGVPQA